MVGFKQLCDISASTVQDLIQPTRMMIHKATHIIHLDNTDRQTYAHKHTHTYTQTRGHIKFCWLHACTNNIVTNNVCWNCNHSIRDGVRNWTIQTNRLMQTNTYIRIHRHRHTCMDTHACMHRHRHIHIHACMHRHKHTHTHTHTHKYTHILTHAYTHAHAHKPITC